MHKCGKWARQIMTLQQEDGSWGCFHSLSHLCGAPMTTEQALRRLEALGFTMADECIRRAVAYMEDCLAGRRAIPDRAEKLHDWRIFTELILSAWIRRFTQDSAPANAIARQWSEILTAAFANGAYDHARYCEAYHRVLGMKPRGGRLIDFANFYPVSLVTDMLDPSTQVAVADYILRKPDGIYYICDRPLTQPPRFDSREASRYLAAIALLARFPHARGQLRFVADWLIAHRQPDGTWDMSAAAKDGVYLPLSDDWRRRETRVADCTERIGALLSLLTISGN